MRVKWDHVLTATLWFLVGLGTSLVQFPDGSDPKAERPKKGLEAQIVYFKTSEGVVLPVVNAPLTWEQEDSRCD